MIQTVATRNKIGERIHLCHAPDFTGNHSERESPNINKIKMKWLYNISETLFIGMPYDHRFFHNVSPHQHDQQQHEQGALRYQFGCFMVLT